MQFSKIKSAYFSFRMYNVCEREREKKNRESVRERKRGGNEVAMAITCH